MRFLLALILCTLSTFLFAQDKVVVIPLGSDVSVQQFNDLVEAVDDVIADVGNTASKIDEVVTSVDDLTKKSIEQRVYGGVVLSNGSPQSVSSFTSSFLRTGVYRVRIIPSTITYDFGDPSIVVTSRHVMCIACQW